jgi:hypothetical protein
LSTGLIEERFPFCPGELLQYQSCCLQVLKPYQVLVLGPDNSVRKGDLQPAPLVRGSGPGIEGQGSGTETTGDSALGASIRVEELLYRITVNSKEQHYSSRTQHPTEGLYQLVP